MTYQLAPLGDHFATGAFEITTGPVAFHPPFGPVVIDLAVDAGLLTPEQKAFYETLPRAAKDQFLKTLIDTGQLIPLGYDPLGLDNNFPIPGNAIDATLLEGDYIAVHSYGWTEFEIDPVSQKLTVTTYGIEPYSEEELLDDPAAILARSPEVVSKFEVNPAPPALAAVASGSP